MIRRSPPQGRVRPQRWFALMAPGRAPVAANAAPCGWRIGRPPGRCRKSRKILQNPSCAPPRIFILTLHAKQGPFVYRLGRQVFNLERGVRFPYGLPLPLVFRILRVGRRTRSGCPCWVVACLARSESCPRHCLVSMPLGQRVSLRAVSANGDRPGACRLPARMTLIRAATEDARISWPWSPDRPDYVPFRQVSAARVPSP